MTPRITRSRNSRANSLERGQTRSHSAEALRYANGVLGSKIPACRWVVLACKRHVDDLERSKSNEFPFKFDRERADRACSFIELLPHTKGRWAAASERIRLRPWQKFIVCSLFGWVHKSNPSRYRFRGAYVEVPRKNGKSVLAAGIGLYKFAADGEFGAEVYSGATTEKQAWEVFRPAKQMCERTPELCKAFGIKVNAKSLVIEKNGSRFEPVIGKPGDGASPSCAIADERHEHQTDDLVSTMRTGMAARENPLLLEITTAGTDRSSPCYNKHVEVKELLSGKRIDDHLFAIIYTLDDGDDWKSPETLEKANPGYGISVDAEWLIAEQRAAIQSARLQNAFKTKHQDIWENADVAWMNMAAWEKCADPSLKLSDFEGQECFDGVDLASRVDLVSKVRLFRKIIDGKVHYYAFWTHYLNQAAAESNSNYAGWVIDKKIVVTPGNVTDMGAALNDLVQDGKRFKLREVDHDPYQGEPLMQFLKAHPEWNQSAELVAIPQEVKYMSPAMKEFEADVLDGRFHFDGDPIATWAVSNVVCHRDAKDNIYPRKQRIENKIDPVLALLNARYRMIGVPMGQTNASVYETRGLLVI